VDEETRKDAEQFLRFIDQQRLIDGVGTVREEGPAGYDVYNPYLGFQDWLDPFVKIAERHGTLTRGPFAGDILLGVSGKITRCNTTFLRLCVVLHFISA
jgi:hypothetical protein